MCLAASEITVAHVVCRNFYRRYPRIVTFYIFGLCERVYRAATVLIPVASISRYRQVENVSAFFRRFFHSKLNGAVSRVCSNRIPVFLVWRPNKCTDVCVRILYFRIEHLGSRRQWIGFGVWVLCAVWSEEQTNTHIRVTRVQIMINGHNVVPFPNIEKSFIQIPGALYRLSSVSACKCTQHLPWLLAKRCCRTFLFQLILSASAFFGVAVAAAWLPNSLDKNWKSISPLLRTAVACALLPVYGPCGECVY